MTKINIKNRKLLEFSDIKVGGFFVFEGVLYCKETNGTAFCTKNAYICPFDNDVQIHLVKRIDVTLA